MVKVDDQWVSDLIEKIEGLIDAHISYDRAEGWEARDHAYERMYHYRDLVIVQLEGVMNK